MKKIISTLCFFAISVVLFAQTTEKQPISIDFSKPVHSLGVSVFSGCSFKGKAFYEKANADEFNTYLPPAFTPEATLTYSCILNGKFGFSLSVPFGIFFRMAKYFDDDGISIGSPYIGFVPQISYFKNFTQTLSFQVDFGIKFMPLLYGQDFWQQQFDYEDDGILVQQILEVPNKNNLIPDVTLSALLFIHGKRNPKNNFIVGFTVNLSFVTRATISYHMKKIAPFYPDGILQVNGKYGWKSSSIGLTLGYRFMGLKP